MGWSWGWGVPAGKAASAEICTQADGLGSLRSLTAHPRSPRPILHTAGLPEASPNLLALEMLEMNAQTLAVLCLFPRGWLPESLPTPTVPRGSSITQRLGPSQAPSGKSANLVSRIPVSSMAVRCFLNCDQERSLLCRNQMC